MIARTILILGAVTSCLWISEATATSHFELCESLAAEIAKKDPAKAQSFLQTCKTSTPKKSVWRKSTTPVLEYDQVRYKCLLESKFTQPGAGGREYFHDLFMACMKAHGYVYSEVEQ